MRALLFFLAIVLSATTAAQSFPARPIRIIIGFPPGGAGEILIRTVGHKLTERWGQAVVVDNKPGASGNIAAGELVRSEPDGYTLLYMPAALVVNPSLFPKVPYDLAKDFSPADSCREFNAMKSALFMKISPRTSTTSGAPGGNRSGRTSMVRTLAVTSSPIRPSPLVAACTRRPCS